MNAAEVIKEIDALDETERDKVLTHLLESTDQLHKEGESSKKVDSTKGLEPIDFSDILGTWVDDPAFDEAMKDFGKIDEELWK